MKIYLSSQVESLTGSLGRGFGYCIESRWNSKAGRRCFYSKRNAKGFVPMDGHWRFICTCAELAQDKLHIVDICITAEEVHAAVREAFGWAKRVCVPSTSVTFNAREVLELKQLYDL